MRTRKLRKFQPFLANEVVVIENDKKGEKITSVTRFHHLRDDGSIKVLNVDQFSGKSFLRNACGFPTNDIMAFEQSQSDSIARAIIQRTQIIKSTESMPDNMTPQQIMECACPSGWSSPTEYVNYSKKIASIQYAHQQEVLRAAAARQASAAKKATEKKTQLTVDPE